MHHRLIWLSALSAPAIASAQPADIQAKRAAEILAVMQGSREAADTFDERFLTAVPPDKIAALIRDLEAANGKLVAVDEVKAESPGTASFRIRFERATATGRLTLGAAPAYQVAGFWIGPAAPIGDDAAKVAADFAALPGHAGFAVIRLGDKPERIAGARVDELFAVGSAFKLWVLDTLAEDIAAGRHRWDEVVRLGPRSLPSGITQDWPEGAPVTVETLATLMISRSDNTATDTLIRLVGRDRIGARLRATGHSAPERMLPLLTTAEAFALKLSPLERREAYAKADDAAQTKLLGTLDAQAVIARGDPAALGGDPVAIEQVEWFASPADLARVLDSLRRRSDGRALQILATAPAMPAELPRRFAYVGYKGGSEPGVLDLTWLVSDKAGTWTVITANWNDPEKPVSDSRLQQLALRLIRLIP